MTVPHISLIICTTPRSGSWLVADGLRRLNIAGNINEWFNEYEEKALSEHWGIVSPDINFKPYFNKVMEAGTTGNGVFGVKCHGNHFVQLFAKLKTIPEYSNLIRTELIAQAFPNTRYVYLLRRDKLRQAISYYRAAQSNIWAHWIYDDTFKAPANTKPPAHDPVYDPISIARHDKLLQDMDIMWQQYFDECSQRPLIIYYEDLIENYERVLLDVLEYASIQDAKNVEIAAPRLKKQADSLTEDWVERYREYKRMNKLP